MVSRELSDRIIEIIVEEWDGRGSRLSSETVYDRLVEDGYEVPDYAMSEVLERLNRGNLIRIPHGRPDEVKERIHGDVMILGVNSMLYDA